MQATLFPKILVLAEGMMERIFINNNFSYATLIPLENGEGWSLDALCDQIASKYFIRNYDADKIVVWIDREKQNHSAEDMRGKIVDALVNRGADPAKIAILLADRMSENVILADEQVIKEEFGLEDYAYSHEGENGKHILKQMFNRAKETSYKETYHGSQLLKKIRLSRCAGTSPSVASFVQSLNLNCWWV